MVTANYQELSVTPSASCHIEAEIGGIPCFCRAIVQASSPGSQARHTAGRMS